MTQIATSASQIAPLVTGAGEDLWRGLLRWHLWGRLGWLEIKRRYRRTMIGPFWSAISMAIFVGALGIIGAGLWNRPFAEYVPFLAAGMVVWLFVSAVINESCVLFVQSSGLFCQIRFEYSIMVFALVWRNFVVFLHNFVVFVLALLALAPHHIDWPVLLVLPGLALLLINAAWVALLFGVICLRFRDLQQLVASLVQIAMFITPIFWPPALLSDLKFFVFVTLNPLFHLIEVVRMPLLGNVPPMGTYVAVAILTVIGWAVTFAVFRQFRRRIAYWS